MGVLGYFSRTCKQMEIERKLLICIFTLCSTAQKTTFHGLDISKDKARRNSWHSLPALPSGEHKSKEAVEHLLDDLC